MKKLVICITLLISGLAKAQYCDPLTPVFNIDLTGQPSGVWLSPPVLRQGLCCGASNPDRCLQFNLTLDSMAQMINFDVASGAMPSGALFYQINCGPPTAVGTPICLNGPGPYVITFCKPGNNLNTYRITSIGQPSLQGPDVVSQACTGLLTVNGLIESSIQWSSVPSNPTYDSYLSCQSGCDSVIVQPSPTALPAFIDYQVTGTIQGPCMTGTFTDTVRIRFVNDLSVSINPRNITLCNGVSDTLVTAQGLGGLPPYIYTWSTGDTTASVRLQVGTFIVRVKDSRNCSVAVDTVRITRVVGIITANAGADVTICSNVRSIQLNGSITTATGAYWSGGVGSFVPDSTKLSVLYQPSSSEISAGSVMLTLTTTGNGGCPAATDQMRVTINPQPLANITGPDSLCTNSIATYQSVFSPLYVYSWTVSGGQIISNTGNSISVLWNTVGQGNVQLVVSQFAGCDSIVTLPVTVHPLPAPVITGPAIVCTNGSVNYSVQLNSGSTYNWSIANGILTSGQNSNSIIVSFTGSGTSSVSVTETNMYGCSLSDSLLVQRIPTPVPVITGINTICENSIVTYSASPAPISSWVVSGGTVINSNIRAITVLWDSPGNGAVTLNQSSGNGCDSSVTLLVTVNPLPHPFISGDSIVCTDAIHSYSSINSIGSTYTWNVSNGQIVNGSGTNSINVSFTGNGNSLITLTETNIFSCSITVYDSIIRIKKPIPVITGSNSICVNSTENYSSPVDSGVTSNWIVTGGTVVNSSPSNVSVLWDTVGTGTVTLIQTAGFGCDTTISLSVEVHPNPSPIISGSVIVCTDITNTYSVLADSGSTYNWQVVNGTITSGLYSNAIDVNLTGSGFTYLTLTQTNNYSCSTTVNDTIERIQKPSPVITGPQVICEKAIATYVTTVPMGVSSSWSVNGGRIVTSTLTDITVEWNVVGSGSVSVYQSAGNGCDTTIVYAVTVNPLPVISLSGPSSLCEFHAATYSVSPVDSNALYDWSYTGVGTITAVNSGDAEFYFSSEGNTMVHVTVTNSFGCFAIDSMETVIHRQPLAQFSGPIEVCKNSTAIYTAINTDDINTWTVTGGTILSSSNQNITVEWTDSTQGSVTLYASNPGFCDTAVTYPVTILPAPTPIVTGNQNVCSNRVSSFMVEGTLPGDNINWYVTAGTILSATTDSLLNVLFSVPGEDTVRVTVVGTNGCDLNVDYPIVVLDGPAPVLTGTDPVCKNDTGTYTVPFKQGHLYLWTVVGGSITSFNITNTIDVYWFREGQGSVTCRQISPDGCDSTVSMNVLVKPLPAPIISGPFQICQNENALFTLDTMPGSTYEWQVDNNPVVNNFPYYQISWDSSGIHSIYVTELNSFGCSLSAEALVSVGDKPKPVINGRITTCLNEGIQRYTVAAEPNVNYHWTISGGGFITAGTYNDTVAVRWNQVGNFQLTLHAINTLTGCDSIVSMNIVSDTIRKPVITAGLSGCSPVNVAITGNTDSPGYAYSWNFGDGSFSSVSNPTHTYTNPGNYNIKVVVWNSFGCKDSVNNVVVVHPNPFASFDIRNEKDFFLAETEPVVLDNNSIGGTHYQWAFGNGETSTDRDPQLIYQEPGIYMISLIVTNSFGCIDTFLHPLEIRVPEEIFIPNAFTPNGDNVNDYFSMTFLNISEASVTIFNRWGEEIYNSKDLTFKWDGTVKGRVVQNEVYVYLVEAKGIYGTPFKRTGKITVFH